MTQYEKYLEYELEDAVKKSDILHIKKFLNMCDRKNDEYFFIRLMMESSQYGNVNIIEMLLNEYKVNINFSFNSMSLTPLMVSARYDQLDVMLFLLENDADPLEKDLMKRTFLHHIKHNSKIKEWLKTYGAQKYLFNKFPALFIEIPRTYLYHPEILKEFSHLKSGSDLNLL